MTRFISRRKFIKGSAVLGATSILGTGATGVMHKQTLAEDRQTSPQLKGRNIFRTLSITTKGRF